MGSGKPAVAWEWQRGWIAQRFNDTTSRFGVQRVQLAAADRLSRLLMALTSALTWVALLGLPETHAQPRGWHAAVAQRARASMLSVAVALLDQLGDLPAACLPLRTRSGYA